MNKTQIAILGTVVVFVGSITTSSAIGEESRHSSDKDSQQIYPAGIIEHIEEIEKQKSIDLEKMAIEQAAEKNRLAIKNRIKDLQKYVNRTAYVFSGSTPSGWDCSGLTMWFYDGLGVELEHSATKQAKYAGIHVDTPIPGDIVAFSHYNSEKYYHVGIYVGDGKIIHARRPGTLTELIPLSDAKFKNSEITFVRILENQ